MVKAIRDCELNSLIFSGRVQHFVPTPLSDPPKYFVLVSDMLESADKQVSTKMEFSTAEEAIAKAQKIIDEQLISDFGKNPNDRPLQLLDGLLDFGFLPTVSSISGTIEFNPRAYAERRCYDLTGKPALEKLVWGKPNLP